MTRLLASKGRHAGDPVPEEDVFARRQGRHCRRLFRRRPAAQPVAVVDDFSRPRPALVPFPDFTAELIPFADTRRHPYSPKDAL